MISCSGHLPGRPVYGCERQNQMRGVPRCFTFGGLWSFSLVVRQFR
jgi:hypothetical protein